MMKIIFLLAALHLLVQKVSGQDDLDQRGRKLKGAKKNKAAKKQPLVPTPVPQPPPPPPPSDPTRFNIVLVNMGSSQGDSQYDEVLAFVKARWEAVITGDLDDRGPSSFDWFDREFPGRSYTAPIDDLVIGYEFQNESTLTPGNVAEAKCTSFDTFQGLRCLAGIMKIDAREFNGYTFDDRANVILHEMGHVLGTSNSFENCNPPGVLIYGCPKASAAYKVLNPNPNNPVLLLEDGGGPTSAGAHWERTIFNINGSSELMVPDFADVPSCYPLSNVTVASLDDLNVYKGLNYSAADAWPATSATMKDGKDIGSGFKVLCSELTLFKVTQMRSKSVP